VYEKTKGVYKTLLLPKIMAKYNWLRSQCSHIDIKNLDADP